MAWDGCGWDQARQAHFFLGVHFLRWAGWEGGNNSLLLVDSETWKGVNSVILDLFSITRKNFVIGGKERPRQISADIRGKVKETCHAAINTKTLTSSSSSSKPFNDCFMPAVESI